MDNCSEGKNGSQIALPRYKCTKEVHALKIKLITLGTDEGKKEDGTAIFLPADDRFAPIQLSADYMAKHKPVAGGYYVVYADGYLSFSPAEAFESGYKLIS